MIVTSVQIKTVKMQKHLYCPVFTIKNRLIIKIKRFFVLFAVLAPTYAGSADIFY